MNIQKNLSSKFLPTLFLIICYWFYLSICVGYFLSKIFYNFFDSINKTSLSKSIKFREKFNLETIKRFIISYILKFFENWGKRVVDKFILVLKAIVEVGKALFQSILKFKLKFKSNFRLLKILLPIFWEAFGILRSFLTEAFLFHNLIKFGIKWKQFILLLMSEYVLINGIVYFLYLILIGLFGVVLGFLLGVYRQKDDIYTLTLLFLLEILYANGLDYVLFEPERVDQFSKFSLKTIKQINPRPLKITLQDPDQRPPIPLPILIDPFVWIDIHFIWDESKNSKFEFFKFYRNVNEKVKY